MGGLDQVKTIWDPHCSRYCSIPLKRLPTFWLGNVWKVSVYSVYGPKKLSHILFTVTRETYVAIYVSHSKIGLPCFINRKEAEKLLLMLRTFEGGKGFLPGIHYLFPQYKDTACDNTGTLFLCSQTFSRNLCCMKKLHGRFNWISCKVPVPCCN